MKENTKEIGLWSVVSLLGATGFALGLYLQMGVFAFGLAVLVTLEVVLLEWFYKRLECSRTMSTMEWILLAITLIHLLCGVFSAFSIGQSWSHLSLYTLLLCIVSGVIGGVIAVALHVLRKE